jgi:RNA polymerase sigma-70 factor, ECF subfamily
VDDDRLLDRMRQGDERAFAELFARHQGRVFRYAAHMCGAAAADDVVQEVFLALLRRPGMFDPARGSLAAYLLGIARHHVSRRLAAEGGLQARPIDDVERVDADVRAAGQAGPAATPLDALARAELIERVRTAIRHLPPVFREVVVLCELNELDYASAAAVIGCPVGTVRSRLHRARGLLTSALEPLRRRGSHAR